MVKVNDSITTRLQRDHPEQQPRPLPVSADESSGRSGGLKSLAVTIGIILAGLVLVSVFRDDINAYGIRLMESYGRDKIEIILFLVTMISCSPICLPVWQYTLVGVAMGYSVPRLAAVMALGSAFGSVITYLMGRYFANNQWITRRFPKATNHPWVSGRSKWYVTLILFLGTASPIPFDVLYFACGVKRYPLALFLPACAAGRFVRYLYLGYGVDFFTRWL